MIELNFVRDGGVSFKEHDFSGRHKDKSIDLTPHDGACILYSV